MVQTFPQYSQLTFTGMCDSACLRNLYNVFTVAYSLDLEILFYHGRNLVVLNLKNVRPFAFHKINFTLDKPYF